MNKGCEEMEIDKDLAARQEARLLCRQAAAAQKRLAQMSQQQLDAIVEAMAKAFSALAHESIVMIFRQADISIFLPLIQRAEILRKRFAREQSFWTLERMLLLQRLFAKCLENIFRRALVLLTRGAERDITLA